MAGQVVKPRRAASRLQARAPASRVRYDIELFELWVGEVLVKRLDVRALNQIAILSAFEEEHWPKRIDDPLSPTMHGDCKARLRDAIYSLNRCQLHSVLRFFSDGSGQGIRWELCQKLGTYEHESVAPLLEVENSR